MTAWVVLEGSHGDEIVCGVYSTLAKAKTAYPSDEWMENPGNGHWHAGPLSHYLHIQPFEEDVV